MRIFYGKARDTAAAQAQEGAASAIARARQNGGAGSNGTTPRNAYESAMEQAALAAQEAEGEDRNVSVPLYVSACVVQLAALGAVGYQTDSPNFTYFTIVMTLLGFATSYYLRRFGVGSEVVKIGAIVLALLFLYGLRSIGFLGLSSLQQVGSTQEMVLVSILALTATFCSFLLLTDDAVIFPCVWAIALIGLTGTVNINIELIVAFVVFFCAAIFLLVHQSHLARQRRFAALYTNAEVGNGGRGGDDAQILAARQGRAAAMRNWLPLLRTQIIIAVVCAVTSLLIGFAVAVPLQIVGRGLSINEFLRRLRVAPAVANRGPLRSTLAFDNPDDFDVGLGPIGSDPQQVLTVRGPRALYWRGRTYEQYEGRGWKNIAAGDRQTLQAEGNPNAQGKYTYQLPPNPVTDNRSKTTRLRFQFRTANGQLTPIYHAAEPIQVEISTPSINVRTNNTLSAPGSTGDGDYAIYANVTNATEDDLRRSGFDYPDTIRRDFLLPFDNPNPAVRSLTQEAIANVPANPWDRAEAIRRFVAERCTYTLEARAVPDRRDAAEFFLNDSREGYCDLYATATTVMCRYAGLPARVATGFVPGTPAENEKDTYILTGDDRHSWTEVYYANYGWIALDATVDTGGVTPVPRTQEQSVQRTWWQRIGVWPLAFGALGILVLLYAAANELYSRFFAARRVVSATGVPVNPHAQQIVRLYRQAVWRVRRGSGLDRVTTATPREYVGLIRSGFDATVAGALEPLTALLERALYSPQSATATDVQTARQHAAALKTALRGVKRK